MINRIVADNGALRVVGVDELPAPTGVQDVRAEAYLRHNGFRIEDSDDESEVDSTDELSQLSESVRANASVRVYNSDDEPVNRFQEPASVVIRRTNEQVSSLEKENLLLVLQIDELRMEVARLQRQLLAEGFHCAVCKM